MIPNWIYIVMITATVFAIYLLISIVKDAVEEHQKGDSYYEN